MPSFDIVSKVDAQTLDNAINNAKKEILNRYDFNGSKSTIELEKKTNSITIVTEDDMRLKAITDSIISRMMKQNLDPKSLDFGKEYAASGNMIRKEIKIKEGIDKEAAKKTLVNFKKDFKDIDATYLYTNPTYKVWVGKYKLRINAEKDLVEIKKKYPMAFLIKPNR